MLSLVAGSLGFARPASSTESAVVSNFEGEHWAVLIAGSNTYGNYRHQSDICHAYQIVKEAGVPESNVIVLAYDDIANSPSNPFPGKIFNKPTAAGVPGVDVYAGCKIDYSGAQVTPETFTKVLTGDASAGGKVLKSGPNDNVFVNFVDHGGVGIIGFPHSTMHATELVGALKTMNTNQMYKQLVFYLEACESGSMFQDLPTDINIYATTASNAKESSWGTYCGNDAMVDGTNIRSCLGDLYSVNWMEDSDVNITTSESLGQQFNLVQAITDKSHVMKFGDISMEPEPTSDFQGNDWKATKTQTNAEPKLSSVRSEDAALSSLFERYVATDDEELAAEISEVLATRSRAKRIFAAITEKVVKAKGVVLSDTKVEKVHMSCHLAAHKAYVSSCGQWSEHNMKYSSTLAKLCEVTDADIDVITKAITSSCIA